MWLAFVPISGRRFSRNKTIVCEQNISNISNHYNAQKHWTLITPNIRQSDHYIMPYIPKLYDEEAAYKD